MMALSDVVAASDPDELGLVVGFLIKGLPTPLSL